MSRVWSDYPRTSFCDIHQFIDGEKRQGVATNYIG